jgi:hypothetical protein
MEPEVLKTIFSGIAVFISIIALSLSIYSIMRQESNSKLLRSTSALSEIKQSKDMIPDLISKYSRLISKKSVIKLSVEETSELKFVDKILKTKLESYLNSIESGCALYISEELNKNHFKEELNDELVKIYLDKQYSDIINQSSNKYPNLTKCYKEWNGT